jgi:hypothetical protein
MIRRSCRCHEGLDMAGIEAPVPLPVWDGAAVVVGPPENRAGAWAGAPSALLVGDVYYLAYRLRRPVGEGRGFANVVARSTDGTSFETISVVERDAFGAESLERPALTVTPDGTWRLYVSCATPGTKHWRVDVLEASDPSRFRAEQARTVLPGDELHGVKDPVLLHRHDGWHLWGSVHPLDDPEATDRMTTEYATSPDGLDWTWRGTALRGRPGEWDSRGVRISAVVPHRDGAFAYYDGRSSAADNWEERTGLAWSDHGLASFTATLGGPAAQSPHPPGGLRYVSVVDLGGDHYRLFYEATRSDGAHELRSELVDLAAVRKGAAA